MEGEKPTKPTRLKERAAEELQVFGVTALYLWVFLGSFTVYRRLVLAETGVTYLHYGIALIEALIIAKVVLIGKMFGFTRRFEDKPLIVPVLHKSVLFGVFVLVFGVVEHLIEGWLRVQGLWGGVHALQGLETGSDFCHRPPLYRLHGGTTAEPKAQCPLGRRDSRPLG